MQILFDEMVRTRKAPTSQIQRRRQHVAPETSLNFYHITRCHIPEHSKLPGLHAFKAVLRVWVKKRYLLYMLSLLLTADFAKVLRTFFQSLQANGWAAIAQSI